jgi:hypothetical protein
MGFVGCGGDEDEVEASEEVVFVGDCAALVECHIGLQEVALNVSGFEKSDSFIRSECETLVIDDYGNDEAACSVGLEELSCP